MTSQTHLFFAENVRAGAGVTVDLVLDLADECFGNSANIAL